MSNYIWRAQKRTCQLRLTSSLIAYSVRTEGAHVK